MGITASTAALLVRAKQDGARFDQTATVGRQSLALSNADLAELAQRLNIPEPDWNAFAADGYCEDFFRHFLGARQITSFDASDYQNATVVHDLNRPIPLEYANAFDALVDGGTIEHIFDVKQVLSNYMALTKVGGHVYICTNANNLCGHGFYQFSPEFFYRVLSEANGFRIEQVCMIETPFHLVEKSPRQRIFEAADPMSVGRRMVIVTDKPVSIYVHARRIADRPLFAESPYQSDYRAGWTAHSAEVASLSGPQAEAGQAAGGYAFSYLSGWQALRRWHLQRRKNSLRNRKWFKPLAP
jgi:hypothetical protein